MGKYALGKTLEEWQEKAKIGNITKEEWYEWWKLSLFGDLGKEVKGFINDNWTAIANAYNDKRIEDLKDYVLKKERKNMKKLSLDEIYELAKSGELKKEDLNSVEELFGKDWEYNYIEVWNSDEAEEFYIENLKEGLKNDYEYGILYYFWAEVDPLIENKFRIDIKGGYANWYEWAMGGGDNRAICSYEITAEVKNELKKMGLDPKKAVDDINLRYALKNAAITMIKKAELAFLKDAAE